MSIAVVYGLCSVYCRPELDSVHELCVVELKQT